MCSSFVLFLRSRFTQNYVSFIVLFTSTFLRGNSSFVFDLIKFPPFSQQLSSQTQTNLSNIKQKYDEEQLILLLNKNTEQLFTNKNVNF